MVSKLKDFFKHYMNIFLTPQNTVLNSPKCAKIVKIKQLKVFQNKKTRWINMLQPLKHVWEKYKMLITNMVIDYGSMESTKANLLNLIGIDTIIGFT